ncbi:MAG: hypothetical protein RIS25_927 [Actinomycetota bacterium]|jgi:hypothetical protein
MNNLFNNPGDLICPRCGDTSPLDIVYGSPSGEMLDAEAEGSILLGGFTLADDQPTHQCRTCSKAWQVDD